jgi:hypothetical protein
MGGLEKRRALCPLLRSGSNFFPVEIDSELVAKNTLAFRTYNLSLYRSAEKLLDILVERG